MRTYIVSPFHEVLPLPVVFTSSSLLLRLILTIHMQIAAAHGLGTTLKFSQAFLTSSFVRGVLRFTTNLYIFVY
jgi:hypothetical protein